MKRFRQSDEAGHTRQKLALKMDCFGLSDRGCVRTENQDAFLVDGDESLFIVSDGIGGHNAGGLASKIVVTVLPALIREHMGDLANLHRSTARDRLMAAIVKLSEEMRTRTEGLEGLKGMGATLVLAFVRGKKAFIAHVGDSRAYLYRKGNLELLTKDHSLVQALVEHGEITKSATRNHPAKHQLTRFIGMNEGPLADIRRINLRSGDQLLLCSDGLTKILSETALCDAFGMNLSCSQVCERLVSVAKQAGGKDNITVVHLAVK